jgi:hypothetical protein
VAASGGFQAYIGIQGVLSRLRPLDRYGMGLSATVEAATSDDQRRSGAHFEAS